MQITSGATPRIPILLVSTADDKTAVTGATPAIQISKNGGAFATATNPAVEVSSGLYYVTLTAAETNTVGFLFIRVTATACDEWRDYHQVT